jgi:hypothetical protein
VILRFFRAQPPGGLRDRIPQIVPFPGVVRRRRKPGRYQGSLPDGSLRFGGGSFACGASVRQMRRIGVGPSIPPLARYSPAMSQQGVEAVKVAYEAFASGGLARYMEHFTDGVDYRAVETAPDDHGPIAGKKRLAGMAPGLDRDVRRVQDGAAGTDRRG